MTADLILSTLGTVITAGGGGAVVAYALFQYLGKSALEHNLAKNLEKSKSDFTKDVEAAKSELSLLSARKLKLHDREYVVFPELWAKLNNAVNSLSGAVTPFREMPDFGRMAPAELTQWLDRANLSDEEKSVFSTADDKIRAYSKILEWRDLSRPTKILSSFINILKRTEFLSIQA